MKILKYLSFILFIAVLSCRKSLHIVHDFEQIHATIKATYAPDKRVELFDINFDLADSKQKVSIATTRPEFLPACVGVFVHPDDKKNSKLMNSGIYIINKNFVSRIQYGKFTCTIKRNNYEVPFTKTYISNIESMNKALSEYSYQSLN